MLEQDISDVLKKAGIQWSLAKDGGRVKITPTSEDVMSMIEGLAAKLAPEEAGTSLTAGGITLEKTNTGHDVYVYMGDYQ